MKITGDAETSAREGVATYTANEEDRHVGWTLNRANLTEMAPWDLLSAQDRRERQHGLRVALGQDFERGKTERYRELEAHCSTDPIASVALKYLGSDWLEQHAIVARNALRNYLGEAPGPG